MIPTNIEHRINFLPEALRYSSCPDYVKVYPSTWKIGPCRPLYGMYYVLRERERILTVDPSRYLPIIVKVRVPWMGSWMMYGGWWWGVLMNLYGSHFRQIRFSQQHPSNPSISLWLLEHSVGLHFHVCSKQYIATLLHILSTARPPRFRLQSSWLKLFKPTTLPLARIICPR